jgi:large subunit ribosomal protein L4
MPSLPVLDARGKEAGTLELKGDVFGVEVRTPLLHQAVVRELADLRAGTHDTRGRSEVSGGGRKPWKQKGTGRARQGSIRATQWKGGGKPFGPTPRSYAKDMPRSMRRAARGPPRAAKLARNEVRVVERLDAGAGKTKALVASLARLGVRPEPALVVVSEAGDSLMRAARNVPWLTVETPAHVSVYQLLRHGQVVFERAGLAALEEALAR